MLEIVEAVVESRTTIAFATEPLLCSLADLLDRQRGRRREQRGQKGDVGDSNEYPPVNNSHNISDEYELSTVECQRGLWQLFRALDFLHQPNVRLIHGLPAPEHIYINSKGDWKLGGLQWSQQLPIAADQSAASITLIEPYNGQFWRPIRQNLDYLAPEWLFSTINYSNQLQVGTAGDLFSLGCVWFELLSPANEGLMQSRDHLATCKQQLTRLWDLIGTSPFIPGDLKDWLRRVCSPNPGDRPSAADLMQQCAWLNSLEASSIRFLEIIYQKTAVRVCGDYFNDQLLIMHS